ncbi:MAG: glycosyltransferase [Gammaproteobacteria bacterium]|jgi:hypothetical protein
MSGERVAVIVPVRDDAGPLANLIRLIGDQPDEFIVVTAGEDAVTRVVCESAGVRCLRSSAGRGPQQHAGALAADSDWLWFLHADATPAATGVADIRRAGREGAVGGYFRFRFEGAPTRPRSILAGLINLRTRLGIPYGDQGLFFRRDVYVGCGGFPDQPLFEEVGLVRCARRRGPFPGLPTPIGVSPRRWERDGWVRRTAANRLLAIGYAMGISPRRLARFYDGREERRSVRRTRT